MIKNIFVTIITTIVILILFFICISIFGNNKNYANDTITSFNIGILQALVGIVAVGIPIIGYIDREKTENKLNDLEKEYQEINNKLKELYDKNEKFNDELKDVYEHIDNIRSGSAQNQDEMDKEITSIRDNQDNSGEVKKDETID